MPDTDSVVIVKSFDYRGEYEEFSNRYHVEWSSGHTEAEWVALSDAIINAEKPATATGVSFQRAYFYIAGTEHSVYSFDYAAPPLAPIPGTYSGAGEFLMPGDCAATIRWDTGELNSRGKKIYCRKYMHGIFRDTSGADKLSLGQSAQYQTFATKMVDGSLPGSARYCGPQGANLFGASVNPWLTTRTLKRRGKRPLP